MKKRSKEALKSLNITLPLGWQDLTANQVSRVAEMQSQYYEQTELLVRLGTELAGLQPLGTGTITEDGEMRYCYYHRGYGKVLLSAEQITAIVDALDWVVSDKIVPMESPEIKGYKKPDRELYGITVEQYVATDQAYVAYLRSADTENPNFDALRKFVAAIYPREAFSLDKWEVAAEEIKYFPMWRMRAVLLWFTGVKKLLADKYTYVFSSNGGGEEVQGTDVMLGMLNALNEDDITKNEQIMKCEIHFALSKLDDKIRIAEMTKKGTKK